MSRSVLILLCTAVLASCGTEQPPEPQHTPEQLAEIEDCVEHFIRNYQLSTMKLTQLPPVPRSKLVEGCTWRVEEKRTWILEDFVLDEWK